MRVAFMAKIFVVEKDSGMTRISFDCSAAIMAGGKSERMGRDKALLSIGGVSAVEFLLQRLRPMFEEIILSTNTPDNFSKLGVPAIPDQIPGRGPLGGIYTTLSNVTNPYLFVIACDMPCVSPDLIKYLVHEVKGEGQGEVYDVVVPETERGLEPLHAIYSKTCVPAIKKQLEGNGSGRVISFFPDVKVRVVSKEEIAEIKGGPEAFLNFNTPEDYRKALELLRAKEL